MMKKQRHNFRKNGRRGFTLVELVVVVALLTVLTAGVVSLMQPTMQMARISISLSEDKQVARNIAEQLRGELTYAVKDSLVLDADGQGLAFKNATLGGIVVDSVNGRVSLQCGGREIGIEEAAYLGRDVTADFSVPFAGCVNFTLTVYDGLTMTYQMSDYVTMLNY